MEVVVWTLIFLGGTALVLAFLVYWAWKKDREKGEQYYRSDS
ncbi:MAG TPA: hypothetical protein VFZ37_02830 [Jiangellaceae bacterium]